MAKSFFVALMAAGTALASAGALPSAPRHDNARARRRIHSYIFLSISIYDPAERLRVKERAPVCVRNPSSRESLRRLNCIFPLHRKCHLVTLLSPLSV